MIDYLLDLDSELLLWVNGVNAEWLDPYVKTFSGQWIWIAMYLSLVAVIVWKFGWRGALVAVAAIGISVGLSDLVSAQLIRPLVQRLRPANLANPLSELVHIVDGYRGGRYGFPSCHAANTMALAVSSAFILRSGKYTAFIVTWALLQCYSRMYLGVHYPGDLLVGAIIGSLLGFASYRVARQWLPIDSNPKASTWPVIGFGIGTMIVIGLWLLMVHAS